MGWLNRSESASRILTRMLHAHATITGFRPWRDASMRIGWGFGGREGARTPDLLVANEALSQLSYSPTDTARRLTGRCASKLLRYAV